jgi:hypothetical protein
LIFLLDYGVLEIKSSKTVVIAILAIVLIVTIIGMANADSGVNATPEVQGITTGTSMDVQGTITETDSGASSLTYDPRMITPGINLDTFNGPNLAVIFDFSGNFIPQVSAALQSQGGSIDLPLSTIPPFWLIGAVAIPSPMLNQALPSIPDIPVGLTTYQSLGEYVSLGTPPTITQLNSPVDIENGLHDGVLDPGQVQYTTGYNDQYSGISGQQTFTKSMAVSTANTLADQSNIKANTNIQYVAIDTGRATRSEDLLLDGAGNSTDTASSILCPFAQSVSSVIPPYCNIVQAGSAFDTTLTSTVTSADTRFIGTDSTFPVVLNYNINSEGLTVGNQSSPMIGSVSAYLKVHVQEARNSTPTKSEDLAYAETSSASGLINHFGKSMSYQSGMNLI